MIQADEGEIPLQATSTPNKTRESKGTSNLQLKSPVLCLRSVFAPLAGYLCELCDQTFSKASELVKHRQLHENPESSHVGGDIFPKQEELPERVPEPSFPCNMCDRSFTTNQSLKRHKLLHVKDGRRCPKCGQIFCQLHNHILFMPPPKTEQDSSTDGSSSQDSDLNAESSSNESVHVKTESSTEDSALKQNSLEDASEPESESSAAATEPEPISEAQNPPPPAWHLKVPQQVPLPRLKRVLNPQAARYFRDDYPSDYVQLHLPQQPRLQPPLEVFSPQRLTSALLEVRRNYEYILGKPVNVEESKRRYTAYDLEVVLQNSQ